MSTVKVKYYIPFIILCTCVNRLPIWANIPLPVPCASGDDDIGYHNLPIFKNNVRGTTHFFRHFSWHSRLRKKERLLVFSHKDGAPSAQMECNWITKECCIHFSGSANPSNCVKAFGWDNVTSV